MFIKEEVLNESQGAFGRRYTPSLFGRVLLTGMVGFGVGAIGGAIGVLFGGNLGAVAGMAIGAIIAGVIFGPWICGQDVMCNGQEIHVRVCKHQRVFAARDIEAVDYVRGRGLVVSLKEKQVRVRMPSWIFASSKLGKFLFASAGMRAIADHKKCQVVNDPWLLMWESICSRS